MNSTLKLGTTYWGKRWIDALKAIYSSTNRFARGFSYALQGAVQTLEVRNSKILARVQGRSEFSYLVTLLLKPYLVEEKKRIEKLLRENPSILSNFSNGKNAEAIFHFFVSNTISLFPENSDEIHTTCTCPDWANPCKHRVSVFYILANEIDKNPAILLEWRGIDIQAILGKSKNKVIQKNHNHFQELSKAVFHTIPKDTSITFETIPSPSTSYYEKLEEYPLFYKKDNFKRQLQKAYWDSELYLKTLQTNELNFTHFRMTEFRFVFKEGKKEPGIFMMDNSFISQQIRKSYELEEIPIPITLRNKIIFQKTKGYILHLREVASYFLKYPLLYKSTEVNDSGRFISHCIELAKSIIKSGSFVPKLEWIEEDVFQIMYNPIHSTKEIQNSLQELKKVFLPSLGFLINKNLLLSVDTIPIIVTYFLDAIFRFSLNTPHNDQDKIQNVFFGVSAGFVPENFQKDETGRSIENWLDCLTSLQDTIIPLIKIERTKIGEFEISLHLEKKGDPLGVPIPMTSLLKGRASKIFGESRRELKIRLENRILVAGEKIPELLVLLSTNGEGKIGISIERLEEILTKEKIILESLGIQFILPKEILFSFKPKLVYHAKSVSTISYIDWRELEGFTPQWRVNDIPLSKKEIDLLQKNAGKLIPFREGFLLVNPDELSSLLNTSKNPKKLSKLELLYALLTGEFEGHELILDKNYHEFIENVMKVESFTLPLGLNSVLRPYQQIGFEWMYSNLSKGINPILADDMGLGKTVQVIAVIQKLKEENKLNQQCLIVCPTSILGNWQKEIERFSPTLKVALIHGNKKDICESPDIVITSYGKLRSSSKNFKNRPWDCLVIDEAQNIKNPLSEQSKSIKSIQAKYKIAMSGTPVENRLTELWSIFDFVNPHFLGSLSNFKQDIAIPIERNRDPHAIEKLKIATSPFLLRRLKTDKSIISDLPDKIVVQEYPNLTREQEVIYQTTLNDMLEKIKFASSMERRGLILKLFLCLKQICNHPSHFTRKEDYNPELSGKTTLLLDLLEKIINKNEKILVFTQYTKMGEILKKMIETHLSQKANFFMGALSKKQREVMIKNFQEDEKQKILLISLKAGGTGLNLVNANHVIHFDLWWNPAVEEQATDRAFRIGQTKNVSVHRLVTLGTFEEKIDEIMKQKRELANLTISEGEKWITEMSNEELRNLFSYRLRA